jgi:hypothetical protein
MSFQIIGTWPAVLPETVVTNDDLARWWTPATMGLFRTGIRSAPRADRGKACRTIAERRLAVRWIKPALRHMSWI